MDRPADRLPRTEYGEMLLNDALGHRSGGLDLARPGGGNISRGGRSGSGRITAVIMLSKKIVLDLAFEDRG